MASTDDRATANPFEPTNGVWSIEALLSHPPDSNQWIIEDFLRNDSQVLIAAAPKTGKSRIASQIALTLAVPFEKNEERFLFCSNPNAKDAFKRLRVNPPPDGRTSYRVLFVSLEMGSAEVSARLRKQLTAFGVCEASSNTESKSITLEEISLEHVFGLERNLNGETETDCDLSIATISSGTNGESPTINLSADGRALRKLIIARNPDVVIFDTLIQLHNMNENDNIGMKGIMRLLRKIAVRPTPSKTSRKPTDSEQYEQVAHIVIHHTRKESNYYRGGISVDNMRGAGSLHGSADLVMMASESGRNRGRLDVRMSSRSSRIPDFILTSNSENLTFQHILPEELQKKEGTSDKKTALIKTVILEQIAEADGAGCQLDLQKIVEKLASRAKEFGVTRFPKTEQAIAARLEALAASNEIRIKRSGERKKVSLKDDRFFLETPE